MTTYFSKEVREGLAAAHRKALKRRNRLRVQAGEEIFPVVRLKDDGFVVAAEGVPKLRGRVDLFDGTRHLWNCLIVAAEEEGGEMIYEFKRQTPTTSGPALDFARDEAAPAGYLTRSPEV